MNADELLTTPPITHIVYIPFILVVGIVIGFVMGRKSGKTAGQADYLGGGDDDDYLVD